MNEPLPPSKVKDTDPPDLHEYNSLYMANHRITGFGIEGVTQHFPCPFCADPDWLVVKIMDFGTSTDPVKCSHCSRTARIEATEENGGKRIEIVQTAGDDPAPYLPPFRRVVA